MLKKSTVLVLGAGASAPYNYPTGIELSKSLVERLHTSNEIGQRIQECGFTQEQVDDFRNAFFRSGKYSVDAFLEHRADFTDIGKSATAAILLTYESETSLLRYDNNWLRYLYNKLNTSFEGFGSNPLKIVTFNYDRTVEHFLFSALKNSYQGKTDEDCAKLIDLLVVHLHGSLGPLPWQAKNGTPYSPVLSAGRIKHAAANIKIIHDKLDADRDSDFQDAKKLMDEAQQIFFLGFGYAPANLERLSVDYVAANKTWGTAFGLSDREIHDAQRASSSKIQLIEGDCMDLVRNYIAWD